MGNGQQNGTARIDDKSMGSSNQPYQNTTQLNEENSTKVIALDNLDFTESGVEQRNMTVQHKSQASLSYGRNEAQSTHASNMEIRNLSRLQILTPRKDFGYDSNQNHESSSTNAYYNQTNKITPLVNGSDQQYINNDGLNYKKPNEDYANMMRSPLNSNENNAVMNKSDNIYEGYSYDPNLVPVQLREKQKHELDLAKSALTNLQQKMQTLRNSTIETTYQTPLDIQNSSIALVSSVQSTPNLLINNQQYYSQPGMSNNEPPTYRGNQSSNNRYGPFNGSTNQQSVSQVIKFQDLKIQNFDDYDQDYSRSVNRPRIVSKRNERSVSKPLVSSSNYGRRDIQEAAEQYVDPQRIVQNIVSPRGEESRPQSSTGEMFKMFQSQSNPDLKGILPYQSAPGGGEGNIQLGFSSVNPNLMKMSQVLSDKKKRIAVFNKNTFNSQVIIDALQQMKNYDWKVYLGQKSGTNPHLMWGTLKMDSDRALVSNIKNMRAVWDHKANFSKLFKQIDDFGKYSIKSPEFIPKTFILHFDTSFIFDQEKEFFQLPDDNRLYIEKTNMGLNGSGIRIIDSIQEYKEFVLMIQNGQRAHNQSQYNVAPYNCEDSMTVQHYMEKPLLINNKKWEFRVFLILLCTGQNWLMFFHHSYIRISLNDYSMATSSVEVHTTHTIHADKYKELPNYEQLMDQTRLLMPEFEQLYKEQHQKTDVDLEIMYYQMKRVLAYGFLAGTLHKDISQKQGSFHMFGNDIIFDESHNPWFIQTNAYPGIYLKAQNQQSVAMRWLAHDTAEILSQFIDNWNFMDQFAKNITPETQFGDWELVYNEATNYNILEAPLPQ